jgi:chemotaxis protein CheD
MTGTPEEKPIVYLKPGEWFYGRQHVYVKTILGSCVAVTMFHGKSGLSAICHALMPTCDEQRGCCGPCRNYARYAECIVRRMGEVFFERGFKADDIEVKLFGGADSLSIHAGSKSSLRVGARNVAQARETIEEQGFKLGTSDVGGKVGRKLLFNAANGEVFMKRMSPQSYTGTGRFLVEQIAGGIVNRGKAG